MTNLRQQALETWLQTSVKLTDFKLIPLAGDASFRRYFRLHHQNQSYIVMDAPPERENCVPFIAIANALRKINLMTPEILASDITQGFLLLTDFGDRLYLKELNTETVKNLYPLALDALSVLQTCQQVEGWTVPMFTPQLMRQEMEWFKQWFLASYLKVSENNQQALNTFFDWLTKSIGQQPNVFMHRDYHSANLMVLPNNQVGILDFQDAFIGPVTYDLASLLRDCYIAWPEAMVADWAVSYLQRLQEKNQLLKVSQKEFLVWFDQMSIQRHLKALMTFSRKHMRDHDANYLQHIPRTLNYLITVSQRYPETVPLNNYLTDIVMPAIEKIGIPCAQ